MGRCAAFSNKTGCGGDEIYAYIFTWKGRPFTESFFGKISKMLPPLKKKIQRLVLLYYINVSLFFIRIKHLKDSQNQSLYPLLLRLWWKKFFPVHKFATRNITAVWIVTSLYEYPHDKSEALNISLSNPHGLGNL